MRKLLQSEQITVLSGSIRVGDFTLTRSTDDLEGQFGQDFYQRMLREPVLACLNDVLKVLVLEAPMTFTAKGEPPKPGDEDYEAELAKRIELEAIATDVTEHFSKLKLRTVFWSMLDAYAFGHKLGEVVWDSTGISKVKAKPRSSYSINVDKFDNLIGVIPGGGLYVSRPDSNLLTSEYFWLFVPRPHDSTVRGLAALRHCYAPWYDKQLARPERDKFLAQFGGGMISLELPPIQKNQDKVLVDGVAMDRVTYYQSLLQSFAKSGGAFTVENGGKIDVHVPDGEGKAFENTFDRADREMAMGFLGSSRAVMEAEHGSKADSETSLNLLQSKVEWLRMALSESFEHVVRLYVTWKYGEEVALAQMPVVQMKASKKEDVAGLLISLSRALESGVVSPEQLPYWDGKLGQPVRDVESINLDGGAEGLQKEDASPDASFRIKGSNRRRLQERLVAASAQTPRDS